MQSARKSISKTFTVILLGLILLTWMNSVQAQQDSDRGYFFIGPEIETSGKKFKDGKYLMHYTHEGVVISENPARPWHDGILHVQGQL